MVRIIVILALIFGGIAMAKDGSVQAPKVTIDKTEEFFNSPEGQDITRMFDEFTSGKKSYDEVYEEYQKKWGGKSAADTPAQVPNAPFLPIR